MLPKERLQFFKRNDIHLIVKVGVAGSGDNEQLLVVSGQLAVRSFAEIAGGAFSPCTSNTAERISLLYCKSGIFINDSEDVAFQPPLEFRLRGW